MELERREREPPGAFQGNRFLVHTSAVMSMLDVLGGGLALAKGPLVLHVPEMASRYYSVQFTDPTSGTDFAYVGTRATGTAAGDYLISGPGWKGSGSQGMTPIPSPNKSVLVIGRVFVGNDRDLPTAYGLSKQIQLTRYTNAGEKRR